MRLAKRLLALLRAEPEMSESFQTPTSMFPFSRKPIPPNIFFSSTFLRRVSVLRMRSARFGRMPPDTPFCVNSDTYPRGLDAPLRVGIFNCVHPAEASPAVAFLSRLTPPRRAVGP